MSSDSAPPFTPRFPLTRRFLALNVAFWTAIAFLFAIQATSRSPVSLSSAFSVSFVSFVPCILLTPVIALLSIRFRFAESARLQSALAHLAGLVGFLTIGGGMMGLFEWIRYTPRHERVSSAIGAAMIHFLAFDALIYVLVATAALAYLYAGEARARTLATTTLQAQLAEARLSVLTAQLQPHFLFNTLNAISALVREDASQAERLLARLSDLLRQTLRDGMQAETTLENELDFLEKYVEVQETRFGPRLAVAFEIDADVLGARVPRLLLQPIVENAIRHGIAPRAGPGFVQVSARRQGDQVRLSVRDDGLGIAGDRGAAGLREGIGLRTTRARLRQMYGDRQEFVIAAHPGGGTVCTMLLPWRTNAGGDALDTPCDTDFA